MFDIPVIDLTPYVTDGSSKDRAAVAAAVDDACHRVGFLQVRGHAVPQSVLDGLQQAIDGFFALPDEQKRAYRRPPQENRGYVPPRTESQSLSLGIQPADRMNDFFEAYSVGRALADYPSAPELAAHADHYAPTTWPTAPARFRAQVEAYFTEAERVARTLVTVFEDALGLSRGSLHRLSDHSIAAMRLINYALEPGTPVLLDGDLRGMGEHTDYGIVTVLWADRVAGLQVLGSDGVWHDVMPNPDCLLVNLGDLAARLTNDRWSSTLHRVRPPVVDGIIRRRRSAAYFFDANADAVVAPLPSCVDDDHPARYRPVSVDEHVRAKIAGSNAGVLNLAAGPERDRVLRAAGSVAP